MRTSHWLLAICAACCLALVAGRAFAQGGGPGFDPDGSPAFEHAITDRLSVINPDAVPLFNTATQALDAGDFAGARDSYQQVLALAPEFPDALRRLSYALMALADNDGAVDAARQAYAAEPSGLNQAALAHALILRAKPHDTLEGLNQAQEATQKDPSLPDAWLTLGIATLNNDDKVTARQALNQLESLAPDDASTHYLKALVLYHDDHYEDAEPELLLANRLGLSFAYLPNLIDKVSGGARAQRWMRRVSEYLGGWLAAGLLLAGAGLLLSRITLAAVNRGWWFGPAPTAWAERSLRRTYQTVLGLSALYFFLSPPVLLGLLVAIGGLMIYLSTVLSDVPLPIMLFATLAILDLLISSVLAFRLRPEAGVAGRSLKRLEAPELWELAEVAAARLSLRPVDAILIAPGVEIYITETGSLLAQLRGRAERQLVLGLGALPGLTRGELRAMVAHEYGHFANDDRTGGSLARRVRVAIWRVARRLRNNGQARWHNPAWLYVSGFQRVFLAISQGATRLQEVMADRSAVMAYGLRDFSDGLRRLVRQAIVFNSVWQQASQAAYNRQGRLANLYDLPEPAADNGLQKKVDDRMSHPAARYDSHPSPNDRVRLASRAGAPRSLGDDNRPAWGLLADPQTLQLEMVAVLQDQVRR